MACVIEVERLDIRFIETSEDYSEKARERARLLADGCTERQDGYTLVYERVERAKAA